MATPQELADLEDLTGRQVGRYMVVRHLASGGMAELYIAKQEAMGGFEKPVVLKVLQPRYARNPRVVSMFLDEARLAAKLNHASIVHVYDVADDGGLKYIAMEYIHGETIADIVKRGLAVDKYIPLEHAVYIASETAAGLAYAHERRDPDGHVWRIVHRDVSPTNILVNYEGQTKIVDFGIARAQDELREEGGILPGKASYMAPEQVRGQGADNRSDIFALGIILYELTLCQRLYRGAPDVVMKRIVNETIAPPTAIKRDYPAALELIVMRALEKRPEDRYQSAEEMRHDLEEFLDESGLRTGNRRLSLYMNELFATDTPMSAAAGLAAPRARAAAKPAASAPPAPAQTDDGAEELNFDRRAPLEMRIEVAAEDRSERHRPRTPAVPAPPAAPPVPAAATATAAPPAAAVPVAVAAAATVEVASPAPVTDVSRKPISGWLLIAAFLVVGIAAMVIMTLR
jgi:tRNA A-37 threonylcarbamoyl transferase component Bud32